MKDEIRTAYENLYDLEYEIYEELLLEAIKKELKKENLPEEKISLLEDMKYELRHEGYCKDMLTQAEELGILDQKIKHEWEEYINQEIYKVTNRFRTAYILDQYEHAEKYSDGTRDEEYCLFRISDCEDKNKIIDEFKKAMLEKDTAAGDFKATISFSNGKEFKYDACEFAQIFGILDEFDLKELYK